MQPHQPTAANQLLHRFQLICCPEVLPPAHLQLHQLLAQPLHSQLVARLLGPPRPPLLRQQSLSQREAQAAAEGGGAVHTERHHAHPHQRKAALCTNAIHACSRTSTAATSSLDCLVGIFRMARLCFSSTRRSRCVGQCGRWVNTPHVLLARGSSCLSCNTAHDRLHTQMGGSPGRGVVKQPQLHPLVTCTPSPPAACAAPRHAPHQSGPRPPPATPALETCAVQLL